MTRKMTPEGQGRAPFPFFSPDFGALNKREGTTGDITSGKAVAFPLGALSLVRFSAFPGGMEKRPGLTRNVALIPI